MNRSRRFIGSPAARLLILLSPLLGFGLTACGGSGAPGAEPIAIIDTETLEVTGGFTKGPVAAASIAAFPVSTAGFKADLIPVATAISDADGRFTLQLPINPGDLLIETSGGEYIDEADQEPDPALKRKVVLGPDEGLQVILPEGATEVAVTIPAQALLEKARRESDGTDFSAIYAAVRSQATQAYGFDVTATLPQDPTNPNASAALAERQYAMLLGGVANVLNRAAIIAGAPVINASIIQGVALDLSDGRIDGLLLGDPVLVTVNQAQVPLATVLQLNDEIARFKNNNAAAYSTTTAIVVNENLLSQPVSLPNGPPIAVDDDYTVDSVGGTLVGAPGVLFNDSDPEDDVLTAALETQPANGQLTLNPDGTFTYVHDGSLVFEDSFSYTASDGNGGMATGFVSLTINQVNQDGTIPYMASEVPPVIYSVKEQQFFNRGFPFTATMNPDNSGTFLGGGIQGEAGIVWSIDALGRLVIDFPQPPSQGTFFTTGSCPEGSPPTQYEKENFLERITIVRKEDGPVEDRVNVLTTTRQIWLPPCDFLPDEVSKSSPAASNEQLLFGPDAVQPFTPGELTATATAFQYFHTDNNGNPNIPPEYALDVMDFNADGSGLTRRRQFSFTWVIGGDGSLTLNFANGDSNRYVSLVQLNDGVASGLVFGDLVGMPTMVDSSAVITVNEPIEFTEPAVANKRYRGALAVDSDDTEVFDFVFFPDLTACRNPNGDYVWSLVNGRIELIRDQISLIRYRTWQPLRLVGNRYYVSETLQFYDPLSETPINPDVTPGRLAFYEVRQDLDGNLRPAPQDDLLAASVDTPLSIPLSVLLANDIDPENDELRVTSVDGVSANGGAITIRTGTFGNPQGLTYTPPPGFTGTDSFTYLMTDLYCTFDPTFTATVQVEVSQGGAVNNPPIAANDAYSFNEGEFLTVFAPGVLSNDSDPDNDVLSATVNTLPANGLLTLSADGSFVYNHDGSENLSDSFTYTVGDGNGGTATGTVNLGITVVNDPPTAVTDTYAVDEGGTLVIAAPGLLANDSDEEGDPIAVVPETAATVNGQVSIAADGSFTYTHDDSDTLSDSFTYAVSDGVGGTTLGLVNLTINPIDDTVVYNVNRVIGDGSIFGTIRTTGNVGPLTEADIVEFDLLIDDGIDTVALSSAEGAVLATSLFDPATFSATETELIFNGDDISSGISFRLLDQAGNFLADWYFGYFTPPAEVVTHQDPGIFFHAQDGCLRGPTVIARTTQGANNIPCAQDDAYDVGVGLTLDVGAPGVLVNDGDADGDGLTAVLLDGPGNASAFALAPDGSFTYTHDGSGPGNDGFIYVANDGLDDSVLTTVTINIFAEQLIPNGGFEAGSFDSWNLGAGDNTVGAPGVGPLEGDFAARLTTPGGGGAADISQIQAANPGDEFNFSAWMLTETALPIGETFGLAKIVFRDANGNDLVPASASIGTINTDFPGIESTPLLDSGSPVNTWIFTQAQGVAPAGTTQVAFFLLNVDLAGGESPMWFDDAQALLLTGSGGNVPTISAPTPTQFQNDVISLYSEAYTDAIIETWPAPGSGADVTDVTIDGGLVKEHLNLSFVTIEFASVDLSFMTHLHLDVWTPDAIALQVGLVDFGGDGPGNGNDTTGSVNILDPELIPGTWVSLDIPLADLQSAGLQSLSDINQLEIGIEGTTLYVDNVYFYTDAFGGGGAAFAQEAYIKASNTAGFDQFGFYGSVSVSADGNTLAVGAFAEDSAATGINGDQNNNSAGGAGAVYVFTRDGAGVWTQQAYIKASNTDANDNFGFSVSLANDGDTLAVGALNESSAATGINGDQSDNSAGGAGAVYVFTRDISGIWSQQAYVKASNTDPGDQFATVTLAGDGNTLAVGAFEDSAAAGINGDQTDNSAVNAGAVYVYTRDGAGVWTQQAYVKASNTDAGDQFGGGAFSLSDDGSVMVVGATLEDSAAIGVDGDQNDNSEVDSGATYVFVRDAGVWSQQAYLKASNTGPDGFGTAVTLSGDGETLAVGATNEDSAATGVDGDQNDNSANGSGAVYVYTSGGAAAASANLLNNSGFEDPIAFDLVDFSNWQGFSGDGTPGVDTAVFNSTNNPRTGAQSLELGISDFPNTFAGVLQDVTGLSAGQEATFSGFAAGFFDTGGVEIRIEWRDSVSDTEISRTANLTPTLADAYEPFSVTGVVPPGADTARVTFAIQSFSGALNQVVFLDDASFTVAVDWSQQAYIKASNTDASDNFGVSVAFSGNGSKLVVGALSEDSPATGIDGDQNGNNFQAAGAVYSFTRDGVGIWSQQSYIKASNTDGSDNFGYAVALSDDSNTLAVGASGEASPATGINGEQNDNSAGAAGAVYVFSVATGQGFDSDGDGLSDAQEAAIGTDPFNPDTDFDGASDFEEVSIDGDPSTADVVVGGDTDPLEPDTDGDDVGDGIELQWATNPHVADNVLYVSAASGNDNNDGSSWALALQSNTAVAQNLAQLPQLLYVLYEPGVYDPLILPAIASPEFHLVGAVGPGEYLPRDDADTIFDGGFGNQVVVINDAAFASLERIDIVNGDNALGMSGGIDVMGASTVVLLEVYLDNNFSTLSGGGLFVDQPANVTLVESTFTNNFSFGSGGGAHAVGTLEIIGSLFAYNSSDTGGGLSLDQGLGNLTMISNSGFLANTATNGGGIAILASGSGLNLFNNLISGNWAAESGGGMYAAGPGNFRAVSALFNTIAYNQAELTGGGYAGINGCDNYIDGKEFFANIFHFNDDINVGARTLDDNFFVERSAGAVCGQDARDAFNDSVILNGDSFIDFETLATGTNLTNQLPGLTFASISDAAGNPTPPVHVEVSAAFAGTDGNTIVGAPCGACTDDGRIRYEVVFDAPQRRVGLQRIWNNYAVTRFFDAAGNLLHEFSGGENAFGYGFVGYAAASADPTDWVQRVELDGEDLTGSRQVGYMDDLYFGSVGENPDFGLGANMSVEFNNIEGGPLGFGGSAADPVFASGFYLDQILSPAIDAYVDTPAELLLMDYIVTDPTGAPDTGDADLGLHFDEGADLLPDTVVITSSGQGTGEGLVDVDFELFNGSELVSGAVRLVGVCLGAGTTLPGAAISSITTLDPVPGCASVLASVIDDDTYRVFVGGDPGSSGDVVLDVYVDGSPNPVSVTVTFDVGVP